MSDFEVYVELRHITEWKDDAVYKTELVKTDWFDDDEVMSNRPRETNLLYSAVSNPTFMTFRRKKVIK